MDKKDELRQKAIANRLAKIIGHTRSIRTMVENGRDCSEMLIQLAAVKSAINNAGKVLLKQHVHVMLEEAMEQGDTKKVKELNQLISEFMK